MAFKQRLNHILEAMGTTTYKIPGEPYHLMADFYLIQLLEATSGSTSSHRMEELKYELGEVKKTLIPYLKKHLLECAGYSIVCELRHVFDATDRRNVKNQDQDDRYSILIKHGVSTELADLMLQDIESRPQRELISFNDCYMAAKAGLTLFSDSGPLLWWALYGGEAWEQACKSWLSLYNAKGMHDTIIYIDKLYSTEHNNGSLLDKNPEYKGTWVKQFLDLKFNANEPEDLLPFASPFMKRLGRMWLVQATKRGWDGNDKWRVFSLIYRDKIFEDVAAKLGTDYGCQPRKSMSGDPNTMWLNIYDCRINSHNWDIATLGYLKDHFELHIGTDRIRYELTDDHLVDKVVKAVKNANAEMDQSHVLKSS